MITEYVMIERNNERKWKGMNENERECTKERCGDGADMNI